MFSILLKKEIKSFCHSYKSILIIFVVILLAYLIPVIKKWEIPSFAIVLLIQMSAGQILYDSFLADKNDGGNIFLINLSIDFTNLYRAKLLLTTFVTIFESLCLMPKILSGLNIYDFTWIILSCFYTINFMFIGSVITDGEEMSTAISVTIILSVFDIALYFIKFFVLRIFFCLLLMQSTFFICKKLYVSKFFRTRL